MAMFATFEGLLLFLAYLLTGLVVLTLFMALYMWVTPYDEAREIAEGHLAPAIALSGAMLGFTFPILMASYMHAEFLGFLAWAIIASVVQLLAFKGMYRLLPRVIETNNSAGALCFAVAAVCAGLINAASFMP
jgi:putative membrane protein